MKETLTKIMNPVSDSLTIGNFHQVDPWVDKTLAEFAKSLDPLISVKQGEDGLFITVSVNLDDLRKRPIIEVLEEEMDATRICVRDLIDSGNAKKTKKSGIQWEWVPYPGKTMGNGAIICAHTTERERKEKEITESHSSAPPPGRRPGELQGVDAEEFSRFLSKMSQAGRAGVRRA